MKIRKTFRLSEREYVNILRCVAHEVDSYGLPILENDKNSIESPLDVLNNYAELVDLLDKLEFIRINNCKVVYKELGLK